MQGLGLGSILPTRAITTKLPMPLTFSVTLARFFWYGSLLTSFRNHRTLLFVLAIANFGRHQCSLGGD